MNSREIEPAENHINNDESALFKAINNYDIDQFRLLANSIIKQNKSNELKSMSNKLLLAVAPTAQTKMLEVMHQEYGIDFDLSDPDICDNFLSNFRYLFSRNKTRENKVTFLKYALKNTKLDLSKVGNKFLEYAIRDVDHDTTRILLAFGVKPEKSDWSIVYDRKKYLNPTTRPKDEKILKHLNTAESIRELNILHPTCIQELDELVKPGDSRNIKEKLKIRYLMDSNVDFIIDYIEAELLYESRGKCNIDIFLLDNLIKLTIFYYIRKCEPEIILPIFDISPETVNIRDKDDFSILTILLSPHTEHDQFGSRPPITVDQINILINALHRHGYDFNQPDASQLDGWQILEKYHLLFTLREINPVCMMHYVIELLTQQRAKNAEDTLMKAMGIDPLSVRSFLHYLAESATYEASLDSNILSQDCNHDNLPNNDYSFLPELFALYQKCLTVLNNDMFAPYIAYHADNEFISAENKLFKDNKTKMEFVGKFKDRLSISPNWLPSTDNANPEKSITLSSSRDVLLPAPANNHYVEQNRLLKDLHLNRNNKK